MSLNYLMLFTFKDFASGSDKTANPGQVLVRTLRTLGDWRLATWLLIMSCFWLMMYTLWDLHPNFLTDWNDSSGTAQLFLGSSLFPDNWAIQTDRGWQVPQEILLNLNAVMIVLLMIPVSWLVRKMRTLESMVIGMGMATAGVLIAGLTNAGWVFLLGVVGFSLGEMLTGPKKNEYLALIAPVDKKGLYLGFVNIPVGVGGLVGSKLQGYVYGHFGEKAVLAQKYLAEHTDTGRVWDGRLGTLPDGGRRRAHRGLRAGCRRSPASIPSQATQLLWDTYDPHLKVWLPFAAIGVAAIIALVFFARAARRWRGHGRLNAARPGRVYMSFNESWLISSDVAGIWFNALFGTHTISQA